MRAIKIILMLVGGAVVLVVGGLFLLMVVGGAADSKQKSDETKRVDAALTQASVVRTTAIELSLQYERNEVSADQKFKDKPLVVSGMVAEIGKDVTDGVYVLLSSGFDLNPIVHAALRKDAVSHAATLSPGNQVSLACIGAGKTIGTPVLSACKFEGPSASPGGSVATVPLAPVQPPTAAILQPAVATVARDGFPALCSAKIVLSAKTFGGMSDEEAHDHAVSVCSEAQPTYNSCIQTGASIQACLLKALPTSE